MAGKPSEEQTQLLKDLLRRFPVSFDPNEWAKIGTLRKSLIEGKLLPLIRGQIQGSLEGKKSPSLLTRLRALWQLMEVPPKKSGSAADFWERHLIKASEWVALQISVNGDSPPKLKEKLSPKWTMIAGEYSFYLMGCPSAKILRCQEIERIGELPWKQTGIYVPRYRGASFPSDPVLFRNLNPKLPYSTVEAYWDEDGTGTYYASHNGVVDPKPLEIPQLKAEIKGRKMKFPHKFDHLDHRFHYAHLKNMQGRNRSLENEVLFNCLVEYIEEQLHEIGSPPVDSLEIPSVSVESLSHPLFKTTVPIGVRRSATPGLPTLQELGEFGTDFFEIKEEIKPDQVEKVALLDLLSGTFQRTHSQLALKEGRLIPLYSRSCFPPVPTQGEARALHTHGWSTLQRAQDRISTEWTNLIASIEAPPFIARCQAEIAALRKRFPQQSFSWSPLQELVVHATFSLVRQGAGQRFNWYHLSLFLAGRLYYFAQKNMCLLGQELWLVLRNIAFKYKADEEDFEFTDEILKLVDGSIRLMLEKVWVLHHANPALLQQRLNTDSMLFYIQAVQGAYDSLVEIAE